MERTKLGERLCQWHSSMHDPVYAVGSFYNADQRYPKKEIVEAALESMSSDIEKFKRMLAGEKVSQYNSHYGKMIDDQRAFAGYSDDDLKENIADLEEIVAELTKFMQEDYK